MTNNTGIQTYSHRNNVKQSSYKKFGTTGALAGAAGALFLAKPFSNIAKSGITNVNKDLSHSEARRIEEAIFKVIDTKGLNASGVKLHNLEKVPKHDEFLLNKSKFFKNFYKKHSSLYQAAKGENAFYTPYRLGKFGEEFIKENEIIINLKKLPTTAFHEMGHALNNNSGAFWKSMQTLGTYSPYMGLLIGLFGALGKKSEPSKNNKKLTPMQKANNFVRNNAGKLAFLATTPLLLEEMKANSHAKKWVKEFLKPQTANKIIKSNRLGFMSHVAISAAIGIGAMSAVKIKDYAIRKSKENN